MQNRSDTGGRENPFWLRRIEPGLLVGTRSADRIRASGHSTASTGRTHSCTRPTGIPLQNNLPIGGRPHIAIIEHSSCQPMAVLIVVGRGRDPPANVLILSLNARQICALIHQFTREFHRGRYMVSLARSRTAGRQCAHQIDCPQLLGTLLSVVRGRPRCT